MPLLSTNPPSLNMFFLLGYKKALVISITLKLVITGPLIAITA